MRLLRFSYLGTMLFAGLAFLYLPLLAVMVYSFNASRLVTVWTGFSPRWYAELLADQQILAAIRVSLIAAVASATLATAVGTAAAFALSRFRRFPGRTLFAGTVVAPLVVPEVMTGISLLLMFVALEQTFAWVPGRGLFTLVLAHASLSVAYVTLVIQARLAGMERDIEEAAADLGAKPATVFVSITLPMIWPAVVSGWLLAFVLSLDDVIIASFTSGSQATTLPMVIFSSVRLGVSPKVNALATILIVVTALLLAVAACIQRRQTIAGK